MRKKLVKNPNCLHNPSALHKRKLLLSKWQIQQFEDTRIIQKK